MQEKRALAQNKSGRIEIHLGILALTHTETQVHRGSGCSCRYAVYKHTKPYNCFLLHTHTQQLNTHSPKHNKIHFMLINVTVHTHTALTYIMVIDTKQHGPLCAVWTSGRSIERYPSLQKGMEMSMPLSKLKEASLLGSINMKDDKHKKNLLAKNPFCHKHFNVKASILQDRMSVYFWIMSVVVLRQLEECVCIQVSEGDSVIGSVLWLTCINVYFSACYPPSVVIILSLHPFYATLSGLEVLGWHLVVQRFSV